MVIALARTGQALGPALMLGTSNNLLSRGAVGFLTLLIFGGSDPRVLGQSSFRLCGSSLQYRGWVLVAGLRSAFYAWRPWCVAYFAFWKSALARNRCRIKNWPRALSNGLLLSVSQNLAIQWLLSWSRPLCLNPHKGQREAQRQIRRSFLCL